MYLNYVNILQNRKIKLNLFYGDKNKNRDNCFRNHYSWIFEHPALNQVHIFNIQNLMESRLNKLSSKDRILKEIGNSAMLIFLMSFIGTPQLLAQTTGCLAHSFGIDAGLYSNVKEFGSAVMVAGSEDWFYSVGNGGGGYGVIDESNPLAIKTLLQTESNPTYIRHMSGNINSLANDHLMIDAIWARDQFGGTGGIDGTSFNTASKNGEDPAIWDPGPQNVLGKNDLIDTGGFMFRDGKTLNDNLWFVGLINRAEPGGDAYMDFEFFAEQVSYSAGAGFSSGGPQLGHTAFNFDASGNITKVGDFIFNLSLTGGGTIPGLEVRLWVSYADYIANRHPAGFTWGPNYDGAFTGSPYGYASIISASSDVCGIVNVTGQNPLAPPWGTKGTKSNTWGTNYIEYSVAEMGINMTHFGLDHASLLGVDKCIFPTHTFIIKTRSSNSFTAQLKDFAGPFSWGQASTKTTITGNQLLSCDNPAVTLSADPIRSDVIYNWTTVDGVINTDPAQPTINVSRAGTYKLHSSLSSTGCPIPDVSVAVNNDPLKPLFTGISATSTVSCSGINGAINLSVTGGTPPLSYHWSNGATIEDPTGLAPGSYSVTVTDNIGCTTTLSGIIVAPLTPATITLVPTPVTCNGYSNGSLNATVTGKSPFTYSWSNRAVTEDISGLPAANYTLTATDADGCAHSGSGIVSQPSVITLSIAKADDSDPGVAGNGGINLTVSGGTAAYTYLWSRAGGGFSASTEDLTNLVAGVYTVLVTDAHGCTASISTTVFEPEICDDHIDNDGNGLIDCADGTCIPPAPGLITPGSSSVCVGDAGVTYSVINSPGYSYIWTVPAGAIITAGVSGPNNNQITVTWGSAVGGQVCVRAVNTTGCGSATASCLTVTVNTVPSTPGTIKKN